MEAWQEREMWVGEKAFVSGPCGGSHPSSERVCICHVIHPPESPGWLLTACRPHAAHETPRAWPTSGLCTQHTPHLLRSPCPPIASPVFLEPPPHAGSGHAHPDGLPQRPCPGPGPLWTDCQFALHMSCCDPDHCQSLLLETELPQVRTGSVWGPST